MGKKEIYFDICEELYVTQGKSLADIAHIEPGYPSERTLCDWRDAGDWDAKRVDHLKKNESIRSKLTRLKHVFIDEALATKNNQTAYAVAILMKLDNAPGLIEKDAPIKGAPKEISEETLRKVKEEIYGIIESND